LGFLPKDITFPGASLFGATTFSKKTLGRTFNLYTETQQSSDAINTAFHYAECCHVQCRGPHFSLLLPFSKMASMYQNFFSKIHSLSLSLSIYLSLSPPSLSPSLSLSFSSLSLPLSLSLSNFFQEAYRMKNGNVLMRKKRFQNIFENIDTALFRFFFF
jgi:hypothetical protein